SVSPRVTATTARSCEIPTVKAFGVSRVHDGESRHGNIRQVRELLERPLQVRLGPTRDELRPGATKDEALRTVVVSKRSADPDRANDDPVREPPRLPPEDGDDAHGDPRVAAGQKRESQQHPQREAEVA